jgi:hypothetical protein
LVSGITSIWQEEDVQVWFWWRIKDERVEGIGLGAMRWQTKSNRPGYLLGSQVFGLTETSGPVLITIPFLWLSVSWRVVTLLDE